MDSFFIFIAFLLTFVILLLFVLIPVLSLLGFHV